MEITGKVTLITDKITVGQKNTEKQSILVKETEHEEDYKTQSLLIDFLGDNLKKIESITTGDIVTVKFNTSTREYNDRVYNNITGRSCELVGNAIPKEQTEAVEPNDDLPF